MQMYEVVSPKLDKEQSLRNSLPRVIENPLDEMTSSNLIENWPQSIKIITLSRFQIWCNGHRVDFFGKTPHKPLELLKCLCAYGGYSINRDRLIDVLWPDSEGDAGWQALRTTLYRLRKLLQHDQAIRVEDRHLSLDPRYVWVDCLAFDQLAHYSDKIDRASLQRALNLYSGHFLLGETDFWVLNLRNRLHAQYIAMVERFGNMLEQDNDWLAAVDCYLRALEIDPVAEPIYYCLMNSYMQLGRRVEAAAAYRRCCQSLMILLGINPNQRTQVLYQKLINL